MLLVGLIIKILMICWLENSQAFSLKNSIDVSNSRITK